MYYLFNLFEFHMLLCFYISFFLKQWNSPLYHLAAPAYMLWMPLVFHFIFDMFLLTVCSASTIHYICIHMLWSCVLLLSATPCPHRDHFQSLNYLQLHRHLSPLLHHSLSIAPGFLYYNLLLLWEQHVNILPAGAWLNNDSSVSYRPCVEQNMTNAQTHKHVHMYTKVLYHSKLRTQN